MVFTSKPLPPNDSPIKRRVVSSSKFNISSAIVDIKEKGQAADPIFDDVLT